MPRLPFRRSFWVLVALVAMLQPMLHVHPMAGGHDSAANSGLQCVLCVHAHVDLAPAAGAIVRPAVLTELLYAAPAEHGQAIFTPSLPSRAPPAV